MKKKLFIAASALAIPFFISGGVSADVTVSTNAMVTLSTSSCLSVNGNITLTTGTLTATQAQIFLSGDWTNNGNFTSSGSSVTFTGGSGSTSTIFGNTSFTHFISTVPSKNLIFQAGATTTVAGTFFLQGQPSQLIQVKSTIDGTPAYLVNSGTNTVSYTNPKDNYAGGGLAILAGITSVDGGNTINWFFGVPAPLTPTVTAIDTTSATVVWGSTSPSSGYIVNASTSPSFSAPLTSVSVSSTVSTGTLTGLSPNTTYYIQVGNLFGGTTSYASISPNPVVTLANPVSLSTIAVSTRSTTSATITWTGLPVSPSTSTSEGYIVRASTDPLMGGTIFSTSTPSVLLTTLTVSGLSSGTTYYFQVGTLNWANVPNYVGNVSTVTLSGSAPLNPFVSSYTTTTATVTWGASTPVPSSYTIVASTASDFSGTLITVSTGPYVSTGVLTGLTPNTTYYVEVGSVFGSTTSFATATPTPFVTLANPVSAPSIVLTTTTNNTATLTWAGLPVSPSTSTCEGYILQASTDSAFGGTLISSTTPSVSVTTLTLSGLSSGTTYYFRVGTLNWASVPNYTVDGSTLIPGAVQRPMIPGGILGEYNTVNQFQLSWHAVTTDTTGTSMTIGCYVVGRFTSFGVWDSSVTVSSSTLSYIDTGTPPTYYYRVVAVGSPCNPSDASIVSDPTNYVDSSTDKQTLYILDPSDSANRLEIPSSLARELRDENNGSIVGDIDLRLVRTPSNETGNTKGYYRLYAVYHASPTLEVSNFSFSSAGATLTLGYQTVTNQPVQLFWTNGSVAQPIASQVNATNTPFSELVRNLGIYTIEISEPASDFRLLPSFPKPRVLNPLNSQNSRTFWSYENPNNEVVTCKIYDIRGAIVRNLSPDNSTAPNTIAWNGRSDSGSVVPTGVYLYKIEAGKKVITGAVVVAR